MGKVSVWTDERFQQPKERRSSAALPPPAAGIAPAVAYEKNFSATLPPPAAPAERAAFFEFSFQEGADAQGSTSTEQGSPTVEDAAQGAAAAIVNSVRRRSTDSLEAILARAAAAEQQPPPEQARLSEISQSSNGSGFSASENRTVFGELGVGDVYGSAALISGLPRQTSVTAVTEVVLLRIGANDFKRILGQIGHQLRLEGQRWKWFVSNRDMRNVTLDDLALGYTLGVGTFGRVRLTMHKAGGRAYVLKCMRKAVIVMYEQEEHIATERRLLASLDHPFINKLAASFQGEFELYMMLEPLLGGELTHLLADGRTLSENATRFYAACVTSALTYLHGLRVAYRDLKPENIVLDAGGIPKLVDFGFAKIIEENDRTYTFCGTPEFLAPEIVTNRGHSHAVDWWALGILTYNMLVGRTPFMPPPGETQEGGFALVHLIYRRAARRDGHELSFPWHVLPPSRAFVGALLTVEPRQRLGWREDDVKRHEFFRPWAWGMVEGIDWTALERKELTPPYMPEQNELSFEEVEEPEVGGVMYSISGVPVEEAELLRGRHFPDF